MTPGPRAATRRPSRSTTPRSYSRTILTPLEDQQDGEQDDRSSDAEAEHGGRYISRPSAAAIRTARNGERRPALNRRVPALLQSHQAHTTSKETSPRPAGRLRARALLLAVSAGCCRAAPGSSEPRRHAAAPAARRGSLRTLLRPPRAQRRRRSPQRLAAPANQREVACPASSSSWRATTSARCGRSGRRRNRPGRHHRQRTLPRRAADRRLRGHPQRSAGNASRRRSQERRRPTFDTVVVYVVDPDGRILLARPFRV